MEQLIIILFIILLFFYIYYCSCSENFMIDSPAGIYLLELEDPNEKNKNQANWAIELHVLAVDRAPSYLDLITKYQNGRTYAVRTNYNVGPIYSYYNDYTNILYTLDPHKIYADLHTDNGQFRVLTSYLENGQQKLKLTNYKIVKKIA